MRPTLILGGGAVGSALAAFLAKAGRKVCLVRCNSECLPLQYVDITVDNEESCLTASVPCISLDQVEMKDALIVVTAKSVANESLAQVMKARSFQGPLCVLQNGLHVENPFLQVGITELYRGVLYVTGKKVGEQRVLLRAIQSSLVGVIAGSENGLTECIEQIDTELMPFSVTKNIQECVWEKTIVNCAFNSICALLEVDNGVFSRNPSCMKMAESVVHECIQVANREGVSLQKESVMQKIMRVSMGSRHPISTLQDIRRRVQTEIESLNLAVARAAENLCPAVPVPVTRLLGELVQQKSALVMEGATLP
jgi:2-dehydropantoate 2-reductase